MPSNDHDASRKGAAVELLVAATCILISGFDLNVSTSLVDDEGVDLVFHRRGSSSTMAVQVKSRSTDAGTVADRGRFISNVRTATFRAREDMYILFVLVDPGAGSFDRVWLVPSLDLERMAKPTAAGRLVFSASTSDTTNDQWSRYRYNRAELPGRILGVLDSLDPTPAPGLSVA